MNKKKKPNHIQRERGDDDDTRTGPIYVLCNAKIPKIGIRMNHEHRTNARGGGGR